MKSEKLELSYTVYENSEDAPKQYLDLLEAAKEAMSNAYAPYSGFKVGSAILLSNGKTILGNNQENSSYPEGLCAERVAVHAAAANYPDTAPVAIALITSTLTRGLLAPCGGCRQVMAQYEQRFDVKMPVIMTNDQGFIYVIPSAVSLLPWCFDGSVLR